MCSVRRDLDHVVLRPAPARDGTSERNPNSVEHARALRLDSWKCYRRYMGDFVGAECGRCDPFPSTYSAKIDVVGAELP